MTTRVTFYYDLIFDYWVLVGCVLFAFGLFYTASKLEDPGRKDVKKIKVMLTQHIEDAKVTIETMQNIDQKVNTQSSMLNQILKKLE